MRFIIRKAEEKDLTSIMKLFEKKEEIPMSPPGKEKREMFSEMLDDKRKHIFIGEKNGIICSFLAMRIERRFENFFRLSAYITDVRSESNAAEILTAVLSRATATAMEYGCSEIILCDRNVTPLANSVYSICGFAKDNTFFTKKL